MVVLSGGVGGAKLAHGLAMLASVDLSVIVNTGDDLDLHGLRISPDVDTVLYTLAGLANPETGWGIRGETWSAHVTLERHGAAGWFRLGDRDLVTHVVRTAMLARGETPTRVVRRLADDLGVHARILPMSDAPVHTRIRTAEGWLEFQEWFVHRRHADGALEVRFDGIELARPSPDVLDAIASADVVVLAPSNPFVSIGTILAVPGMEAALLAGMAPVVAVSPIVAGAALKGPADRMFETLGGEPSAAGVARHYASGHPGLVDALVIDVRDEAQSGSVAACGIAPFVRQTVMTVDWERRRLAADLLDVAGMVRPGSPPAPEAAGGSLPTLDPGTPSPRLR